MPFGLAGTLPVQGNRPGGMFALNPDSPQRAGLIAFYPTIQGSMAPAFVGRSLNSFAGTATFTTTGVRLGGWGVPSGKVGTIIAYNALSMNLNGAMSMSAWFIPTSLSTGSDQQILKIYNSGTGDGWQLIGTKDFTNKVAINGKAGGDRITGGTTTTNAPVLVTATHDGATLTLYQNGVSVNSVNPTAEPSETLDAHDVGGGLNTGPVWHCAVYNICLTPNQVWTQYDPKTRWDLLYVPSSRSFFDMGAGTARYLLVKN
jgi:hypothetical protein